MASVGWRRRGTRYQVWWRLDDGSQGSKSYRTKQETLDAVAAKRLEIAQGTWRGRQRAKLPFLTWAAEWWELWAAEDRSPTTLAATESRYRRYVLPWFEPYALEAVTPKLIRRWQQQLARQVGHESVMACRSILYRILQHAEDEGALAVNPLRKVPAPKQRVDPDVVLGQAARRVLTPEEAGRLLAAFPAFWQDHVLTLLGTGLRFGEFAGLRRRRVDLAAGWLYVVETRYQAGKFGSGFKDRPKSTAGIRAVPLARQVTEAITRRLPPGGNPDDLVFTGPGGGFGAKRGARTVLSRDNFRRLYRKAAAKATGLEDLDLRGPHDLRHTFSTWLEDAGIPARVIDELMGHQRSGRTDDGGSRIGTRYRHTTPEMAARVVTAVEERLDVVLKVAAEHTRRS